ncbi:heparin cofactor 2 [Latimeria chalumnae]|uniref:Serpin family D member 1 n=1 Tax=Latimeria chalumnae TaxID=7897 RepID=H3AQG8_LATCH|nr:PREDICTED: heparin cofactor 2 [Latimeria chalumnae]|eukprot:XP_005990227.2 PREDICTED: heparin cofactor 2 [Latimeria chalumnae]
MYTAMSSWITFKQRQFVQTTHSVNHLLCTASRIRGLEMQLILLLLGVSLLTSPALCEVKDLRMHFDDIEGSEQPKSANNTSTTSTDSIPTEYHQVDTITNDLMLKEDEMDYLDLDLILGEDDDYPDEIDEIEPDAPDSVIESNDREAMRAKLLKLFRGKTRIQRLNIVNADFGFRLYRSLRNTINSSENILLAPVGISTILAMISLGAQEETHQQILSTLGFYDFVNASTKYEVITVHKLFRKLTHRLFRRNFGYTLHSVNDLYIRQNFNILDTFRNSMKNYYFAEPLLVDFSDPAFITKANQRVLKLTKGLIREALKKVDPHTLMMVLNSLYFKGSWENKFPPDLTRYDSFRLNEKETVRVQMMQTKRNFLATVDHELDCDVLQMPYVGNISMFVAVPRLFSGMKNLENKLTSAEVEKWINNMTNRTREVLFPRFKLEKNYNLIEYLEDLGLMDMFHANADFSGIADKQLIIKLLNHQGKINVNEEGTEAAAQTHAGFTPLTTQNRFTANRPFLFLIYEHRTSCLLFMGRVANPLKS